MLAGHNNGLPPANSIGNEAQWYIDIDTNKIYLKSSGQWSSSGTLAILPPSQTCAANTLSAPVLAGQLFICNGIVTAAQ